MSEITQTVSGNIKYSAEGLRQENYFIQTGNCLMGLDTQYVSPDDLRSLADHLEMTRGTATKPASGSYTES
ncbi:hypothetical protein V6259_12760 [Marinomonas sp. TI.3.20]|uniref:hypothetical protein n=1 Tax=Marinomonas sp. TI.3.20 TaxID=3121296 RepID=UPI00311D4BB4